MQYPVRMRLLGGLMLALPLAGSIGVASAATSMKACSVKYQAAKTAGTLNGQDWKAFRAAQCGSGAATASPVAVAATATGTAPAAAPGAVKPVVTAADSGPGKAGSPVSAPVAAAPAGNATFPTGVDAKYSSLTAGKARQKTCLDQYHANKANGGNGGLKWLQKGGGYYSQCSKKLKGA